ncbi:MAG: hypothetical protein QN203_13840 [Armatimonadota bacterium]|nr:hypothetical protein [Armatimonadota bacterium]
MTTRATTDASDGRAPGSACRPSGGARRAARRLAALACAALAAAGGLALAPLRPDVPPDRFRERTVLIAVDGTPGLPFEGAYGTASATQSARGVVPARFELKSAVAVVATFTKAAADGELVVRIVVDGQEVARRQTSRPFGTVAISQMLSR